jgi:hypothetical protein
MRKIANTTELQTELSRLLDYAGSYQPSRAVLASELNHLSYRMAADTAPQSLEEAKQAMDDLQKQWGEAYGAWHKAMNGPQGTRSFEQKQKDSEIAFKKWKSVSKALKAAQKSFDKLIKQQEQAAE